VSDGVDAILAVDLGTTEAKAGVISLDGRLLGAARARYGLHLDEAAGIAEQDAEEWWDAFVAASRAAMAEAAATAAPDGQRVLAAAPRIVAIAFDGHGPSLVPTDQRGRPVAPAITWLDRRPLGHQARLEVTTGLLGWSLGVLPAGLWLEEERPVAAAKARWYLNSWEYLGLRLSGRAALSLTPGQPVAPAMGVEAAGLPAHKIPPPIPVGSILDGLLPGPAGELGLEPGIPVVAGHVDAFASFNGAGMRAPGDALDVGGTAGGFGVYTAGPFQIPGLFSSPAPIPGLWNVGGAFAATGRALDWFRDAIIRDAATTTSLIAEAVPTPPGAAGLLFLPYLAGERSPLWDPLARGAFAGLTLAHDRGHFVRAILEGAALAIRHIVVPLDAAGIRIRSMVVCGGPAQSRLWNQIKADVTGLTVEVPAILETAVVGAAVAAAVAVGAFPDLAAGIGGMVRIEKVVAPREVHRETYDRLFAAYTALHPAISPILRPLVLSGETGTAAVAEVGA
jgi:xylulokinase